MKRRTAFTLIELLVVLAIVVILAAILFPVFAQARENARRATCQSNEKQIALGLLMYTQDYDSRFMQYTGGDPAGAEDYWDIQVQPYLKSTQILRCPSAPTAKGTATDPTKSDFPTYALAGGGSATGTELYSGYDESATLIDSYSEPSQTWMVVESTYNKTASPNLYTVDGYGSYFCQFQGKTQPELAVNFMDTVHFDGSNVAFLDGHVKWIKSGQGNQWLFDTHIH